MTIEHINNVSVLTKANLYFDGKCVSHSLTLADGSKKSVGVILPSTLSFTTSVPEVMECVAGRCEYRLAASEAWASSAPGEKFSVPANASFELRVTPADGAYHYLCHFG